MKTVNQVNRYVSQCDFPTDDWSKLRKYLKQKYGKNFHKATKPKARSTFQQFTDWEKNGYATGDIVRVYDTIGIISINVPGLCTLAAYSNPDDGFSADPVKIDVCDASLVSENERDEFLSDMNKLCYAFSDRFGTVTEKLVPKPYSYVSYNNGYGIVSGVKDGIMHMVFAIENEKVLVAHRVNFIQSNVRFMNKGEAASIDEILEKNSYYWNDDSKKLERKRPRAKEGRSYWYITDKFTLKTGMETFNATCNMRYARGNYFTSISDATEFLTQVIDMRVKI